MGQLNHLELPTIAGMKGNRITPQVLFGIYLSLTLLMPITDFGRLVDRQDAWLHVIGNALDSAYPVNRDFILGLLVLAGGFACAIFSGPARLRLLVWDVLVAAWIATPLVAGVFNPSQLTADAWQSLYLAVVWGGPYVAGRMAVRDLQDLAACLRVLVTVGLVSAAVGLTELLGGRYVYGLLYGFHPNQEVGEFKLLGTRPLLCFEDPNQIAMWWLTVALAAVILIPGWTNKQQGWLQKYAALALPFVFQGIGASVLTLIGLLGVRVKLRFSWKPILLVLLLLSGLMFAFRGPMLRVARQSARQSGMEQRVKELLRDSSIGSLGWRLVREEEGSQSLETNRWFGWGTVYFWQQDPAKYRPWGFVSLVNGAYGLVGAVMVLALFFAPISYFVFNRDYSEGVQLPFGLTLLWGLHGVDALLNPAFFLPMLFLLGGKVRLFPGIKIPG